ALALEDHGDGRAGAAFDLPVEIDQAQAVVLREPAADAGLSGAGGAYQDQVGGRVHGAIVGCDPNRLQDARRRCSPHNAAMNQTDELLIEALAAFAELFQQARVAGEPDPTAMAV